MSFIDNLVRSNGYKNFMAKLYGWGAAVVIIGALFKINHWPGGELMLIIGMGTETVIFFLSAFEPPHVEFDWTLVYPQLAGMEGGEGLNAKTSALNIVDNEMDIPEAEDPLTARLDKMLEDAKITPDLIERLGKGMENLADSAQAMNGMASAAASTDKFVNTLEGASEAVGNLHKLSTRDELQFLAQLQFYLMLFHLCGPTHLLGLSLSREALLIGAVDGIAHIKKVFGNQQCLRR